MSEETDDAPYSGRIVGNEHRFAVRIYYEDTDAGGVVYHARYLGFFERARFDMLTRVGIDFLATLAADGSAYVVAEAELKYRAPARLGDALTVVSSVGRIRSAGVVVHQRVMRNDQVVVEGRVAVVFVGPDGRPRRQPEAWITAFEAISGGAEARR
ncbi:YbgC/FadM family acyl-CoA thioesterase [Sphingomonas sp. BIUV-7]|uniref:YbgC/FadM family acyl-CoA thioesterase n=1 Tax=Sphingomonas natans TaxID=3063330 RepID=A0ABT8Y4N8_9SPHN|nr:YbgC/FadM family acyl-CoA thioesterase [Sphingomonas sp. BIUV-7]MDO6413291.1 YbgC/FadM family acyl-CoA thioesterase [Sphingomonas sp. BIUV-7]